MSTRRPSTDSPRSTEPTSAKKAAPARRARPTRPEEKEAVSAEPTLAAHEPREPARERREAPVAVRPQPTVTVTQIEISPDQRRAMVAEAAYLRAERRGFAHGNEVEDWLAAEAEVDRLLQASHGTRPQ
jgi:hypothetical protein